jgi:hypothetical protein
LYFFDCFPFKKDLALYLAFWFISEYFDIESNDRLTTTFYEEHDELNFTIVNFPFLCKTIPLSPAYGVYIFQLIQYTRTCYAYENFLKARPTTNKKVEIA